MDIVKKLDSFYSQGNKLYKFTHIKEKDANELGKELLKLYGSPHLEQRLLGSLINAVLSSDKPIFILTLKMFNDLVKDDRNLNKTSVSGTEYKRLLTLALDSGIISVVVESSKFGPGKRRAGLLRLVDKDLRSLIPNIHEIEKQAIELFCKIEKIETIVLTKIET